MTTRHRIVAISLVAILLLTGFAVGRLSGTSNTRAADETQAAPEAIKTKPQPATTSEDQFYLSDYKTGYNDGYNAAMNGQTGVSAETSRAGYNEGYKEGYADAYQAQAENSETNGETNRGTVVAPAQTTTRERVVYRTASRPVYYQSAPRRSGPSKMTTALRIAAPAAVGAGVGAWVGGKKGAGVGALLGGGGGAFYDLFQRRKRN